MMDRKTICIRDTDNDGDCAFCHRLGCPMMIFSPVLLDAALMTEEESINFRANASFFIYEEPGLGTVRGYRNREGKVLLIDCKPSLDYGTR